jgi:hypothetical protein
MLGSTTDEVNVRQQMAVPNTIKTTQIIAAIDAIVIVLLDLLLYFSELFSLSKIDSNN